MHLADLGADVVKIEIAKQATICARFRRRSSWSPRQGQSVFEAVIAASVRCASISKVPVARDLFLSAR